MYCLNHANNLGINICDSKTKIMLEEEPQTYLDQQLPRWLYECWHISILLWMCFSNIETFGVNVYLHTFFNHESYSLPYTHTHRNQEDYWLLITNLS